MNHTDFLSAVAKHQPCTSRDLYLPLLEKGYYSTKPENEAIEDIAKVAHYLKTKGMLISEKQTGSFGVRNVWSVAETQSTTQEETNMNEHAEMASDVAELSEDGFTEANMMPQWAPEMPEEPEPRKFITRVTRITVGPKGEDIFSDSVTHIEIDDEGGGEFIKVRQGEETFSGIRVDADEWPAIAEAIDMMLAHIEANEQART